MTRLATRSHLPRRGCSCPLATAGLLAAAFVSPMAGADSFVIGGFSTARGGVLAIDGGAALTSLRASIVASFPGTTFTGSAALSSDYLSSIDILFISSATGGNSAIVPLTTEEISAVRTFIDRGGTAVLVAENDSYAGGASDPANESVIAPVNMDVTGTGLPWAQQVSIPNPASSPITSGPFGTVTTWAVGWTGWFNAVPAEGVVLGTVDQSGLPGLVVFPRHSLAACSGAVVVFADVTAFYEGYFAIGAPNDILMRNTIAYVGAPSCSVGQCGDIDGNGQVDGADLGALLAQWGNRDRATDLNADGTVNGSDLGILLANWGACSE